MYNYNLKNIVGRIRNAARSIMRLDEEIKAFDDKEDAGVKAPKEPLRNSNGRRMTHVDDVVRKLEARLNRMCATGGETVANFREEIVLACKEAVDEATMIARCEGGVLRPISEVRDEEMDIRNLCSPRKINEKHADVRSAYASLADALCILSTAEPDDISNAISNLDGIDEILEFIDSSRTALATIGRKIEERCESDANTDIKNANIEFAENPEAASDHVRDALYKHARAWYVGALTSKDLCAYPWSTFKDTMDSCIIAYTCNSERPMLKPIDYPYIKESFRECMLNLY